MPATLPSGIGTSAEVDQANQFMREQPWYQDYLQSQNQTGAVELNGDQQKKLLDLARQNGVGISDHFEVDESGNIHPKSHLARNLLIAAGIGTAAVFAAPALAGMLAGGGGAAGGAGAAATGAGVGVGETGATLGLAGSGLAGSAGGIGAATVGAGGASTLVGAAGAAGGTGGTLSGIVGAAKKFAPAIGAVGKGISDATSGAGNTRRADTDTNVNAQANYANELNQRAKLEQDQRHQALSDVYRQGFFADMPHSPYNPTAQHGVSSAYMEALGNLQQQGSSRLKTSPKYSTDDMAQLKPYETKAGTLEKVGRWLGPILSTAGTLGKL